MFPNTLFITKSDEITRDELCTTQLCTVIQHQHNNNHIFLHRTNDYEDAVDFKLVTVTNFKLEK